MSNDSKTNSQRVRKLSATDKIVEKIGDVFDPEANVPKEQRLDTLSPVQSKRIQEIGNKAIIDFVAQMDELVTALGMLRVGHHVGWKVLFMVHSKKTIRKYEDILGIKIREIFPERGPSAGRSTGLAIAENFQISGKLFRGKSKLIADAISNKNITFLQK